MESRAQQREENVKKEVAEKINEIPSISLKRKLLFIQNINIQRTKFQEDNYENEYLNLKHKYDLEYTNLYNEISCILRGNVVPSLSEQDLKKYEISQNGETEEFKDYWLTALKNSNGFLIVNENDEKILQHLIDVKLVNSEDKLSYSIEFHFSPNQYFDSEKLTKTYFYDRLDHKLYKVEATKIQWKSENLIPNKIIKTKTYKSNLIII